jgi:hypothetical protein
MQPITRLAVYLMRPSSSTAIQLDWKALAFFPLLETRTAASPSPIQAATPVQEEQCACPMQ